MNTPYRTQTEVLEEQLLFRRCRIGHGAAREIARRVEDGHGFWDYEERKRAHQAQMAASAENTSVVGTEVHDGVSSRFLAGLTRSSKEAPRIAA